MPTSTPANVQKLLKRIAIRQRLSTWASRTYLLVGIFGVVFLILLLLSRFLAVLPDYYTPLTLIAVPLLALLMAYLFHRRPTAGTAARLIDDQQDNNDLFLTVTELDKTAGEFQPLVRDNAAAAADTVDPTKVLPFVWLPKTRNAVIILVVLGLAAQFLPQLDPFGEHAERDRLLQREKRLEDSKKATELQLAKMREKPMDKLSSEVKESVAELTKSLKKMKPNTQEQNAGKLREQQKKLNDLWRRKSEEKLRNANTRNPAAQRFGGGDRWKVKAWREGMQNGDLSSIKKELEDLKKKAEQLAATKDPEKAQRLQKELKQEMGELAAFLDSEMKSKALRSALERAAEQIDMAGTEGSKGMKKDAAGAAAKSLELSKEELAGLQQTMDELAALQQALKAAQLAKQLNADGEMDGSKIDPQAAMAECAALFQEWLAQNGGAGGRGDGMGMGGEGQGEGGVAPTDPFANTNFKEERANTHLQAGEILMEWETKELAEAGKVSLEYLQTVRKVQQGVSQAILQEQVPAGYHRSIQKYFDTIDDDLEGNDE